MFLTILNGFSQTFQWGATWRDMVLNAQTLERERDRIELSKLDQLDFVGESNRMNDLIIGESRGFFERILGRSGARLDSKK